MVRQVYDEKEHRDENEQRRECADNPTTVAVRYQINDAYTDDCTCDKEAQTKASRNGTDDESTHRLAQ